jgi:hypothetical protein
MTVPYSCYATKIKMRRAVKGFKSDAAASVGGAKQLWERACSRMRSDIQR